MSMRSRTCRAILQLWIVQIVVQIEQILARRVHAGHGVVVIGVLAEEVIVVERFMEKFVVVHGERERVRLVSNASCLENARRTGALARYRALTQCVESSSKCSSREENEREFSPSVSHSFSFSPFSLSLPFSSLPFFLFPSTQ